MNPLIFLAASCAGGAGAVARYLIDRAVRRALGDRFPWGIVVVNLSGCAGLGIVSGMLPEVLFVLGAGFLGGYTTFSTAMADSVALWQRGSRRAAVLHGGGMLVGGVFAAAAGAVLSSFL